MRLPSGALTVILLLLWLLVTELRVVTPIALPSPLDVGRAVLDGFSHGSLATHTGATLARWWLGLLVGSIPGTFVGFAMGRSRTVYEQCEFPLEFLRAVPIVGLLPLFLVFFGIGNPSKLAASAFAAFLYTLINAMYGARATRVTRLDFAHCYRAPAWPRYRDVLLPDSLPVLVAGFRVALSMSLVVVVATEMLLGTSFGLGRVIYDSATVFRMPTAYSAILLSGALGYLANKMVVFAERRYLHWGGR